MSFYTSQRPAPSQTCANCCAPLHSTLTKRQSEILAYLQSYIAEHGYAPSFVEIAARQGYTSLATVHEHLASLERKGWIRRSYNESRAIEILSTTHGPAKPEVLARLAELKRLNDAYAASNENYNWSPEDDALMESHCNTFGPETIGWLIRQAAASALAHPDASTLAPVSPSVGEQGPVKDTTADVPHGGAS